MAQQYRGTTSLAAPAGWCPRHTAALAEGCDGPTRPVLVGSRVPCGWVPFFRRLTGDGRVNAAAGDSTGGAPWSRRRSVRLRRVRGGLDPDLLSQRVVTDPDVKATYAVDESVGAAAPGDFEVVRARDLGDVVEVMRHAHETRTPVVPQGARSALTGASVAIEGGIVLNVEALNTVSEVDALEGIAVAGPGVINADLKAAAAQSGLFYPPTPPPPPSARSAATSPPTPAGCAASSTASPPTTSAGCRSCCPAARSSAPAGAPPRESPGST